MRQFDKSHVRPRLFEPSCSQVRPNCVGYRFVWQGNWKWLARGRPISGNAAAPPKGKAFLKKQGPDGLALSEPRHRNGLFDWAAICTPNWRTRGLFAPRLLTRRPNHSQTAVRRNIASRAHALTAICCRASADKQCMIPRVRGHAFRKTAAHFSGLCASHCLENTTELATSIGRSPRNSSKDPGSDRRRTQQIAKTQANRHCRKSRSS